MSAHKRPISSESFSSSIERGSSCRCGGGGVVDYDPVVAGALGRWRLGTAIGLVDLESTTPTTAPDVAALIVTAAAAAAVAVLIMSFTASFLFEVTRA